jgi:predicted GIY-YIG superfamily endonuclease
VIHDRHLPDWTGAARRAALSLRATTAGQRGAGHSVYVILLEDRRRACRWGLYVGETSRDPDLRFDQHKAGYKASRYVTRFGVRLLPDLTQHLNPLRRWEAIDLEAALADAFRSAGVPWVEGGH